MFKKLSMSVKLLGSFGAVLVVMILVGLLAMTKLAQVNHAAHQLGANDLPSVVLAGKLRMSMDHYRRSELQLYLKNTDADLKNYADLMGKIRQEMDLGLDKLNKVSNAQDAKHQITAFSTAWKSYEESAQRVRTLIQQGRADEAQSVTRGAGKQAYEQADQALESLQDHIQKRAFDQEKSADTAAASAQLWIPVLIVLGALLGVALSLLGLGSIRAAILRLAKDAEQVATGDLSIVIDVESRDEIGQLSQSFEKMVASLRELIGRLADSSAELSRSAADMQNNASQMANGAEEVAGQATTVATASEEMSATAGYIAQNCVMAADNAKRTIEAASHGASVVEGSIQVMHRISDRVKSSAVTVEELGAKSDEIGSIISTIENIADQTNLLALNAAIEAARAGEQGRGFAVVADEVRALAERTTKATKEIDMMIKVIQQNTKTAVAAMEEGVAEVETGTGEAARSGQALRNIQEEINGVNMQVQQIATAAEEQTATTREISANIHQINQVAYGTVEQARATFGTAQHLARLSDELHKVVGQFRLSESGKFIEWSRSYSVDVSQMDREHQRLIDLINQLYTAMREGRGKEAVGVILDELIDYTKTHFAHEEQWMRDAKYSGYDEQKRLHEALVARVLESKRKYAAGETTSQEIMSFLKDWLIKHIQGTDKLYAGAMHKAGYH